MNSGKFTMTLVMLAIFIAMVAIASQYPPPARFMPFLIGIPAIVLCLLQLYLDFRSPGRIQAPADTMSEIKKAQEEISRIAGRRIDFEIAPENLAAAAQATSRSQTVHREMIMWVYFLGLVGGVLLFGFLLALPVFLVVFLRHWAKTSWRFAFGLSAAASLILYLVFIQGLHVVPHPGFVTDYLLERVVG